MKGLAIWIIESDHKNPNDFYVRTDESEHYTALWVAYAHSIESANALLQEASAELELGETSIIRTSPVADYQDDIPDRAKAKIQELAKKIKDTEDVQMAAWISSNGGLW